MTNEEMAYQSMLAAKDSSYWALGALIVSVFSSFITLFAVVVARKGLGTWKDQHITIAKAEWVASLADYAAGISYLPPNINSLVPHDKESVEKAASLLYECVKRWKILQIHLENNQAFKKSFLKKYEEKWAHFGTVSHNGYMSGKVNRTSLKNECIALYNT